MDDPIKKEEEELDFLGMSDEDIANIPEPPEDISEKLLEKKEETKDSELDNSKKEEEEETKIDDEKKEDKKEKTPVSSNDDDENKTSILNTDDADLKLPVNKSEEDIDKKTDDKEKKEEISDSDESKKEEISDKKKDEDTVDYKAEYEKILGPFNANGTKLQAKNTADVLQLMQMGANYHKKMAGLKPIMKTVKLLEKNDLMDPEKLAFLIDVHNGNPEAITKLVKDKNIDPLNIDTKEESTYKVKPTTVTDSEIELDEILDELEPLPSFQKTLSVLTDVFDADSRKAIHDNPNIIRLINEQIEDGTYDKIMESLNYERSFGRLKGVSTLQAYKTVGDILDSQGLLYPKDQSNSTEKLETDATKKSDETVDKKEIDKTNDEKERQERREKASPTRKSQTSSSKKTVDPLDLPDDVFEKMSVDDFKVAQG